MIENPAISIQPKIGILSILEKSKRDSVSEKRMPLMATIDSAIIIL